MKPVACCILSYEITKGMKSFGPMGLLKSNKNTKELILHQINNIKNIFNKYEIYVMSGFLSDKLNKKLPQNIKKVFNPQYDNKNHGYAFKLILSSINIDDYSGLFIINNDTLIRHKNNKLPLDHSWILNKKHKNNNTNKRLGSIINSDGCIDYIFYDIGDTDWCNSAFITSNDLNTIKKNINQYYDNMFLFEIINKSISKDHISYKSINIGYNESLTITGIKDKNKIKEYL